MEFARVEVADDVAGAGYKYLAVDVGQGIVLIYRYFLIPPLRVSRYICEPLGIGEEVVVVVQRLVPRDAPPRRRREGRGRLRGDDILDVALRLVFDAIVVGDRHISPALRVDDRIAADVVIVGPVIELVVPVRLVGEGAVQGRGISIRMVVHSFTTELYGGIDHRVFVGVVFRAVEYRIHHGAFVRNVHS